MKKLLYFALLSFSQTTIACFSDLDCRLGSRCIEMNGKGYCMGGMQPGNSYDQFQQNGVPGIRRPTEGNTCSFDLDCGLGGECLKFNSMQGTCAFR